MARRRRKSKSGKWVGRLLTAILAIPALYLAAALIGSLVPVNRNWTEPAQGTTIYIADNGVHADIIMPVEAQGLDWRPLFPNERLRRCPARRRLDRLRFGRAARLSRHAAMARHSPATIRSALAGGPRVIHVEYVPSPYYAVREIRLRPEEYRRLWATIRADFALDRRGRPKRIAHPGYGPYDAFYHATGKASAIHLQRRRRHWLRLAGVKASLWPPFDNGLTWRYRRAPE